MKIKLAKVKQRQDFYKDVRTGKNPIPLTAFEHNYKICWDFKKKFKKESKESILIYLKELANVSFDNHIEYSVRRKKKHPKSAKCFCCKSDSFGQHHIILIKNGGYDNGINRIPICFDCHKEIHPWLKESS